MARIGRTQATQTSTASHDLVLQERVDACKANTAERLAQIGSQRKVLQVPMLTLCVRCVALRACAPDDGTAAVYREQTAAVAMSRFTWLLSCASTEDMPG